MNATQHVTIPALASLEDRVSPLRCDCTHFHTVCTGRPIGYKRVDCVDPMPVLACFAAYRWYLEGIEDGDFCMECGRDCAECWSVVMLP